MKNYLLEHIQLTDKELDAFIAINRARQYSKNDIVLNAGSTVRKLLFIQSGIIRGYRIVDGDEFTHFFFAKNSFATDYESYLTDEPGELFFEALTDVSVLELDKSAFERFCAKHEKFNQVRAMIAEQAYLHMVKRSKNFQTNSLKERYEKLIEKSPSLFNKVPLKHIASYLGVTAQSLSRIRG
jgi:CRP-like cAMP-binding protein